MGFNFREIEHNLCVVMDARMPMILCPGENIDSNAVICYGYVDKTAGFTFEVLCLASYVDGDYTIVNENKEVGMKVRGETYENAEIIPIRNAAIMKRFKHRIDIIENGYYSNDDVEAARKNYSIDQFRHPFFPDDVQAILFAEGLKPETIWVRLTRYAGSQGGIECFEGTLLNTPFDPKYNLRGNESVIVAVSDSDNGKFCFIVPMQQS